MKQDKKLFLEEIHTRNVTHGDDPKAIETALRHLADKTRYKLRSKKPKKVMGSSYFNKKNTKS